MSETRGAVLRRRLVTIPGFVMGWASWLALAPVWFPLAILVDVFRRNRGVTLRSAALVTVYLSCEIIGMVTSAGLWMWGHILPIRAERWTDLHFRLEAWWGATLFRAVVCLFGLRLEVEGADDADLARGPYLLLLRHASAADTLLASALVSRPHRFRLRYVLKQELLWDPCLDIVGHRIPNVFVGRDSDDSRSEVHRLQEVARDLGPRDGILIYPEGTRFSQAKRQRVIERFHKKGDMKSTEYARSLTSVLPPRPGGSVGLLEAAPEADVVICAHTGFDGAASFEEIWRGALLHKVVRIQFRRISRNEIPKEREERIHWIREEWQRVEDWVASHPSSRWK